MAKRKTASIHAVERVAEAALRANAEHEDLRDTVQRLETLVMDKGRELRALRDELRKGRNGGGA